jgi:prophage DNA circulation protein
MAQFTPAAVTPPGPIGDSMLAMQTALGALFRRCALAQLATTLTTYQPSSQDDANSVLGNAVSLIDAEIVVAGDAGDDNSYLALRALRQAVVADLQARGANLAQVSRFNFSAPLPALVLANRIYRDASRADQLVKQVAPVHPAFCPTSFQALSE